ncbi:MAG: porin [Gammaproteobacteria bacterium]|nr:porin [Gammaproteobacteria bacterium]
MKKTIISLAIAAGMAASGAAFAEATVYGLMNLSIDSADTGSTTDSMQMKSQTSAIGVKGSEDVGDGVKAFYKAEFQFNADQAATVSGRDQYVGLKTGMGTVKLGAMATNYKQKGSSVDPMFRTSLEGRGALAMQSKLHGGSGTRTSGRSSDLVQYASPKMGGMQLVVNTTFAGDDTSGDTGPKVDIEETIGVGFRYEAKAFSVYVDMIDMSAEDTSSVTVAGVTTVTGLDTTSGDAATKIGGTYTVGPVKLGLQLEQTEDLMGSDYMMFSANYSIDDNNKVYFTFGSKSDIAVAGVTTADSGSTSYALAYDHKMSKATDLYVGYGARDDAAATSDDYSVLTAGLRVKF